MNRGQAQSGVARVHRNNLRPGVAALSQMGGHEETDAVLGLQRHADRHGRLLGRKRAERFTHRVDRGRHVYARPHIVSGQDSDLHGGLKRCRI